MMMSLKAENENEGVVQPSAIGIVEVIKNMAYTSSINLLRYKSVRLKLLI